MSSDIRLRMADGTNKIFQIHKTPTGKRIVETMVRVDEYTIVRTPSGRLYSIDGFPSRRASYVGWTWGFLVPFAKAMLALELITKEDLAATEKVVSDALELREKEFASKSLQRYADELGIPLTKRQKKRMTL